MHSWAQDIRCGLHSGIPKCCIRFWLKIWSPLYHEWGKGNYDAYLLMDDYYPLDSNKSLRFGYIPCPDCKTKGAEHAVPLKECDCCIELQGKKMGLTRKETMVLFHKLLGKRTQRFSKIPAYEVFNLLLTTSIWGLPKQYNIKVMKAKDEILL
jgi:hypothetical protein